MGQQNEIYALNRLLADYAVVYVKLHRYEWYAKGTYIFLLQTLCRKLRNDVKEEFDQLATYILSIDGKPFATMIKFIKEAHIQEATADDEEAEMIGQLIRDFEMIQEAIRDIIELNDAEMTYYLMDSKQKWATYLREWKAYQNHT